MAETGKMKTYSDAIDAMLSRSVIMSTELLDNVETFVRNNPHLGYATREEFIQDTVRLRLMSEKEKTTHSLKKRTSRR